MDYPRIRSDINAFPVSIEGKAMICFQDSLNLSQGVLVSKGLFAGICPLLDGRHSVRDIQYEFMRQYGELVYADQIEEMVQKLDDSYLLDTLRFRNALDRLKKDFAESPQRSAFLAGKSYPAEASALSGEIHAYFTGPEGPGVPVKENGGDVKGIMAPHIDLQRGGSVYAHAYKTLAECCESDLYVILGIAHAPSTSPFCLTSKDFETPLGIARTDKEFVKALSDQCHEDFFREEFLHRSEHSIEFQVVFLQSILGPTMKAKIVPILCGSLHAHTEDGEAPRKDPAVSEFLDVLKGTVENTQKRICFVAGVDLTHMGLQFGDLHPTGPPVCREIMNEDLELLGAVENLDGEGFLYLIERDGNRRHICGFPAIYTLLKAMDASRGKLLKYGQAPTPDGRSVVSFAAMAFYG